MFKVDKAILDEICCHLEISLFLTIPKEPSYN